MGADDNLRNKGQELGGKAKEAAGKAGNDPALEREGRTDQKKSGLKQAAEKVKKAFKK